jgi:ubiquinone/menaquinone biosynthesis C-methylase UbiE
MSAVEQAFCRSAPWRRFARSVVLPWAVRDEELSGDVLEIGGGSGVMAEQMLRRFPDIRLTLVDLDPAMIAMASRRLAAPRRQAAAVVGDVTQLPFDDGSFDVVTSYLMLHHVIDWPAALAEVSRVLRPGGRFLGYDLDDTRLARVVHRLDGSPHRLIAGDVLRRGVTDAGLQVTGIERSLRSHVTRFGAIKAPA